MPDKWEYPWFAAWDLAFHMIPMAKLDPQFAKEQLILMLREWYMHPNAQLPAYDFAFNDTNPPVHAWAVWRVYKMTAPRGHRDVTFLARAFQKLLLNFTWWVNRKDITGKNIFAGGFLGLDNIGIFDRSRPLPGGGKLEQADGTAWVAFYCGTMLSIALELASHDPSYEDVASKFFEHFVAIVDAINTMGGTGLWDETDGFYYDHIKTPEWHSPLRVRSLVGIIPAFAVEMFQRSTLDKLPGFAKRFNWFIEHRKDLARHISFCSIASGGGTRPAPPPDRMATISSPSRRKKNSNDSSNTSSTNRNFSPPTAFAPSPVPTKTPPTSSTSTAKSSNSNMIPATPPPTSSAETPTGADPSGSPSTSSSSKPSNATPTSSAKPAKTSPSNSPPAPATSSPSNKSPRTSANACSTSSSPKPRAAAPPSPPTGLLIRPIPNPSDLLLFHEYFDGDTGAGLGASHQTGWTALISTLITSQPR